MYGFEKTLREDRFPLQHKNPSFSSSLLDKIYRSIDEGEKKSGDMKFCRETVGKKQSRSIGKCNRGVEEEDIGTATLRRACLLEKWMDKKVNEKVGTQGRLHLTEMDRKLREDHDHDQDVLFFSSTSTSSDSSSGGFSSSDTESLYRVRTKASCFAPPRPKPVRTSVPVRSDKAEKRQSNRFYEHREVHLFDSSTERIANHEESLIKSKSRALKIYNNLKKVKQPISPGARLTNFINSLFTTGHTKKTKSVSSVGVFEDINAERKLKSGQASTCSSVSSFSRSCLSKSSPSSREKARNGVKRTVRFYPVSVIVDEDSRPCGHKCLYQEEDSNLMPMSVPTAWKIGRSPTKKNDQELKFPIMEKTRPVEEAAREFLKEYYRNQRKSDLSLKNLPISRNIEEEEDEDDDDDAASYASSDLFELDHLAIIGNGRYSEELPVYETTHVGINCAIANGHIV
ncbi:hypothetical protein L6164_024459 [Bauhinia variegata]|uniref:Uncharacterized protein n=1 Tax=Bauhinia variegata TaxID=167791 RepID=A0ACB9LYS1_BAUVA|nr:hypothetical protein L6164_024459 [Bauhinia variegata]